MNWKARVKEAIPTPLLNNFLLTFPFLYKTGLVFYETNIAEGKGVEDLLKQLEFTLELEGDIIECGSSRCGSSIIIGKFLRERNIKKIVYACDSFEGFDLNELNDERQKGLTDVPDDAFTSTSYEYVKSKIKKLGYRDTVIPIKGFFKDTLPYIKSNYSFALIDCDLKESMIYSAENIWPKLSHGGRILFDDYLCNAYKGSKIAVDSFVEKYKDEISEHGLLNRLYYVCKK